MAVDTDSPPPLHATFQAGATQFLDLRPVASRVPNAYACDPSFELATALEHLELKSESKYALRHCPFKEDSKSTLHEWHIWVDGSYYPAKAPYRDKPAQPTAGGWAFVIQVKKHQPMMGLIICMV